MKAMIWNIYGIMAAKHGSMNTSTAAAEKRVCSLYARENCIGFMVIFGKDERKKFEKERDCYSKETQTIYDKAQTYHDGKWMMFEPTDTALFSDFMRLLSIKRKPNR